MRKEVFSVGEFYHIYNRGTDKRKIFLDKYDFERFLQSMQEFNTLKPIGSIYENSFVKNQLGSSASKQRKLVNCVAYCLNPNHYHFILQQTEERGVEKFMQRLGTGFTNYFNNKYHRSGVLFQGKFKSRHIDSNEYLLHISAYVNLNDRIHRLGSRASKSSWEEYVEKQKGTCEKKIILDQFRNIAEYKTFAKESLKDILARKQLYKELETLLFD
ncbi:MAG: transposase [Candidatus Giovannonibacteria bacterium]|nr:MAG: transposase [Candidatus Giovannonibacteria bacterium]